MKNERIIGLDFLRAIAIIAVVFAHTTYILHPLESLPGIGKGVLFIREHTINLAVMGVELFFVLSGFLIGTILIKAFVNANPFSFHDVKKFWVRRWFRTLPNYWLIFTVNLILYHVLKLNDTHASDFLGYLFLQNLWSANFPYFFSESWSLSVEEWFYIILPLIMCLASALFRRADKRKLLLNIFIGFILAFLFIRFLNSFHRLVAYDPDDYIRKIVLYRLDAAIYGVLIAYFNYYRHDLLYRVKNKMLLISLPAIVILYYFLTTYDLAFRLSKNAGVRFFCDVFLYSVLPLVFALCLPYASNVRKLKGKIFSRIVLHISKISYSMYLVHLSLVYIPFFLRLQTTSPVSAVAYYLLYWTLVISLSSLLYKYFEYPVMQLRERFSVKD